MESKNIRKFDVYDLKDFNFSDFDTFLHRLLKQTKAVLNADAGTIYIFEDDYLKFRVFQNDSLEYQTIYEQYKSLKNSKLHIFDEDKYLAVKSFNSGKILIAKNIDVSFNDDFKGVKEFDKKFNYKTKSIITTPIINQFTHEKIGVLQLINKKNNENFDEKDKDTLLTLTSLIAMSVSKVQSDVQKLKELNDSLVIRINEEVKENEKKSNIIFHQAKLASLGEMIGNISHQWRQPLNAISLLASSLSYKLEHNMFKENEALESLHSIVENTQYLSHTIDDFRNFYKIDKYARRFSIKKSIEKCISILNASFIIENIRVITNFKDDELVNGYENELKQVFINIFQNSKDAFIDNNINTNRFIFIKTFKSKDRFIIEIYDSASGIEKKNINKIFQKGFTTKNETSGTGIGLYMSKYIIEKSMNGVIEVENKYYKYEGNSYKGALFRIKILL